VDEGHHVGVLLNGARLAQVAEQGALVVLALHAGPGELGESHHRHVQLLRQPLQTAGDGRNLLGAILVIPLAGRGHRGRHQLQVIHHHQIEAVVSLPKAAGLGAHLGQRNARRVVDEDAGLDQLAQRIL